MGLDSCPALEHSGVPPFTTHSQAVQAHHMQRKALIEMKDLQNIRIGSDIAFVISVVALYSLESNQTIILVFHSFRINFILPSYSSPNLLAHTLLILHVIATEGCCLL